MNYVNLLVYGGMFVGSMLIWYIIVYYVMDIIEWWLSK